MKRLLAICALLAVPTTALAEQPKPNRFGARVGVNIANAEVDPDGGTEQDSRIGAAVGAFASIAYGPNFSLEPGIAYSQRGFKVDLGQFLGTVTAKADYLDFPVLAVGRFPVSPAARLRGFAGGAFSINVSAKVVSGGNSTDTADETTDIDFAVVVGAGADFNAGPSLALIDIRYEIGLVNAIDDDTDNSAKNRTVSINGGFAF